MTEHVKLFEERSTDMLIKLVGDTEELINGVRLIAEDLGIRMGDSGYVIDAHRRPGGIELNVGKHKAEIFYERPCHFYRALMLLTKVHVSNDGKPVLMPEIPRIKRVGLMLDVSRNAVLTVDSVKHFLRKMAIMGMDLLMLYMEDIYFLEGYDRFGYMRGRYTEKELIEIDDYASCLGIEVMPYIQTLAHLKQVLKWDDMEKIRDTAEIILVGEEETYQFLEHMIRTVSSFFRSNRINIGMDEAHELGLGRYLELQGYRERKQLMQEHLTRVLKITDKLGLTAMIASDMLFHNSGGSVDHYEMGDSSECAIDLPDRLDLMYWDYFHTDVEEIREFIRRHKAWGKMPTYLGTVRTFESFSTGYSQSFVNTSAALEACALEGVEEAVISVWLNDGAENNQFAALPGMSFFAQQVYNPYISDADFKECFRIQTGADFDSFLLLGGLDEIKMPDGSPSGGNPSKYLLWQDVLLGFFDYHFFDINTKKYYRNLTERMEKAVAEMGPYKSLMETMSKLSRVLTEKSGIGIEIKGAYDAGDKQGLEKIARDVLPRLSDDVESLRVTHRKLWMETLKPFGWELLDARYGGLRSRLETTSQRLLDYTSTAIPSIPELDEKRMPYKKSCASLPVVICYDQIVSSGYQNGPSRIL